MRPTIRFIVLLACSTFFLWSGCKFSHQKQDEYARQDSIAKDSKRRVVNPYKQGQGTQVYDQQRQAVGNLDTLVTPQNTGVPGR